MNVAELVLNGAVAILLLAVIASSFMLHRRLDTIRSGQGELRQLIEALNKATGQAQASIGEFRRTSLEVKEELSAVLSKAKAMKDELTLVIEAADSLASRIEERITRESARIREADARRPSPESGASNEDAGARKDLLNALKEAR